MLFQIRQSQPKPTEEIRSTAILVQDLWDDWLKYRTQFFLMVFDAEGKKHDIGDVKIGQIGLKPASKVRSGHRAPELDAEFPKLDAEFFSLGQGEDYYENIHALSPSFADQILVSLRDCAYDLSIFEAAKDEEVMNESLLRFISKPNVLGKLHRLAHGDAKLTPYFFQYVFNEPVPGIPGPELKFRVRPYQQPPTSVHVLIGRNGVGKTRFLQSFANCIVAPQDEHNKIGNLILHNDTTDPWSFSSLVYVSFSAFDDYQLPNPADIELKAAQVSLRGEASISDSEGETTKAGVKQFIKSLGECRRGTKKRRWQEAIKALESDPLFDEARVDELINLPEKTWKRQASDLFVKLSSGHAVVLLTITRLVELVDEYTIVLIDEPEGHLHPPLLSALIRSLSDLLTRRNGVAIIATHSPVVLQEVPKSCVWKLRRAGLTAVAERPELETFGENVGTLTAEVFGLEVTASGFHKLLSEAVKAQDGDYEAVVGQFNEQLGAEARAIVRGLSSIHNQKKAS